MLRPCGWRLWLPVVLLAGGTAADVSYTEEVVNAGLGASKRGARRTVNEVHIKGTRQRVQTTIETSAEMRRTLEKRGVAMEATTILRLDQGRVFAIDSGAGTYKTQPLPPAKPAAKPAAPATPGAPAAAGKPAAAATATAPSPPDRDVSVRTKVLPDTIRVAGIACRRVAAEMLVQHFKPGTTEVARTNRYLYQAWMAEGFPGYDEMQAFRLAQEQRTALPPLIRGGLEQLAEGVDDAERLESELAALRGFPMQSELTVHTTVGSRQPALLFQLNRKILTYTYQALPDTLFQPSPSLKAVK